jgi:hypothetical protein
VLEHDIVSQNKLAGHKDDDTPRKKFSPNKNRKNPPTKDHNRSKQGMTRKKRK